MFGRASDISSEVSPSVKSNTKRIYLSFLSASCMDARNGMPCNPSATESSHSFILSSTHASIPSSLAGYFSGCALVAVGHPFDLVKVRLQNDGGTRFKGVLDCVRQTYVREGIHGFYKGMASPLFATGFLNSILFGLQGMTVEQLRKWNGPEGRKTATVYETMLAGAITGGMIATIATPMEGLFVCLCV